MHKGKRFVRYQAVPTKLIKINTANFTLTHSAVSPGSSGWFVLHFNRSDWVFSLILHLFSLLWLHFFVQNNYERLAADSCCFPLCVRAPSPSRSAQIILSMDMQQAYRSICPRFLHSSNGKPRSLHISCIKVEKWPTKSTREIPGGYVIYHTCFFCLRWCFGGLSQLFILH